MAMSDNSSSLFAYGSLQLQEVFEAVTRQAFKGAPAVLEGFRRTRIRGFGFPAIIPAAGAETSGMVYHGLGAEAWRRLDAFEDDFYERKLVMIRSANGALFEAHTYVLSPCFSHMSLDEPWTLGDLDSATVQTLLARL